MLLFGELGFVGVYIGGGSHIQIGDEAAAAATSADDVTTTHLYDSLSRSFEEEQAIGHHRNHYLFRMGLECDDVVLAWGRSGSPPDFDDRVFRSADGGQTWTDLGEVADLGLHWVVYQDSMGRTRALRDGESDTYLFPITMISRRREVDNRTSVAEIYGKARDIVLDSRPPLPFQ